ncbi:MAG TPA: DUF3341 domain-containing protein [Bryobacterales bacterium]|nr:DUF3341 domain-containing protein [Bryobacterales bacterium]
MSEQATDLDLYGMMAEFESADAVLEASKKTYAAGYRRIDAFTPFPVHGLAYAVGYRKRILPWIVLAGGIVGGLAGFFLQYWVSVIELPLNVGGRPLNSWPSFIPVTFECTILGAALSAVLGMLALNGLPRPNHPVFNVPRFERATTNRFFLLIESRDAQFDLAGTRTFLESLEPSEVMDVEK